jgi:integrase
MTVKKIDGEYWIDTYIRRPGRKTRRIRRRSPVQTKRGSQALEKELIASEFSRDTTSTRTVAAFARKDFATWARANNSPAEYERKEKSLRNHILPWFGALRLDEVTPKEIEKFKVDRMTPKRNGEKFVRALSPKSIVNNLSVLRKLLVVAKKFGELGVVPDVEMPKLADSTFDFFTFDEAAALALSADAGQWATMIFTALRTGLRCGELRALRWEDVDTDRGVVHVRQAATIDGAVKAPKNNRFRDVPLSDAARDALKAHRHLRGEFVFCGPDGSMLLEHEVKHPLRRACRRAKLRIVGWHVLRHTFASHLAMRGVPLLTIQKLLGHRTITMTLRYAHLAPVVLADAVAKLDMPLGGRESVA